MDRMTYSGVSYKTSNIGTYTTKYPFGLNVIGSHRFTPVRREEDVTYIDPFMMEAFRDYGERYDFSKLEGWSRSLYTKVGHMMSIHNFQSYRRFHKPNDKAMIEIDQYCKDYFTRLGRVHSLDFNTQLKQVPFEPTSSAGIGIPGRKGDEGNLHRAIRQASATIHRCFDQGIQAVIEDSAPDMAYTRTQLTQLSHGLKVRNVFGEAFQYILIEGCTASPLMDFFVSADTFFFAGKDPRIGVPTLLEEYRRLNAKLISIDWHAFDSTIEQWEINDAFDLLELMLIFPNIESRAAFEFSKIFFINRKIAAPDGNVYFKQLGVPSGSFFTMLIDSIVNWRRILYLHMKAYEFIPEQISVQGDDSIFGTRENVTPEGLYLAVPQNSRWSLNPNKCPQGKSGSTVPFLQRTLKWGDHARDVERVERLAIYPEYPVTDGQISSYRARALWEDCNYESPVLAYATSYLEGKYGVPTSVPKYHTSYWDVMFETKHRAGER